jgi:hypothetical protein
MAYYSGKGSSIGYATTLGGSYTTIGSVTELPQPTISSGNFEVTANDSTAVEKASTQFNEIEDLTFTLNFTGGSQETTLKGLLNTTYYWKVTRANGQTSIWQGWISKVGGTNPTKNGATIQVTITASIGTLTVTAGS